MHRTSEKKFHFDQKEEKFQQIQKLVLNFNVLNN